VPSTQGRGYHGFNRFHLVGGISAEIDFRRLQATWSRGGAGRSAVVRDGHAVAMPQGFPYARKYTFVLKLSSKLNALSQFSARLLLTPLHRVTFVLRRLIASVLQLLARPVGDTLGWQAYHNAQRRAAPAGHPAQGGGASAPKAQGERS
jgi:hypothetical protein